MHLQRIQVPDFRVLKDVDITFEKDFTPRIFPLGSQNGGGKSTLLQLIFVLLHCSINPERVTYLKNMLRGFKIADSDKRTLVIIDIWDGDKTVKLEFLAYKDFHFKSLLDSNGESKLNDGNHLSLSVSTKLEEIKSKIFNAEKEISILEVSVNASSIKAVQEDFQGRLDVAKLNLEKFYEESKQFNRILQSLKYLHSENLIYICNYSADENKSEEVLLCHFDNIDMTEAELFLEQLSQKVFLAAPSTQIFLFFSQASRKLLFREQNGENNYYSQLKVAKPGLPGFFPYDFLAVDLLIESFKAARDRDFIKAIETDGEYGSNYKELLNDLNILLVNKKINLDTDISGVRFKLDREGENIELYPEDLSHGELKRLSIYVWIKFYNIEDAIVLMDEIEIAFHPDWQYQIVSDLKEWSPSNQYILATHSYELCQALTPSHVKELEPKLIKQKALD